MALGLATIEDDRACSLGETQFEDFAAHVDVWTDGSAPVALASGPRNGAYTGPQ